TARRREGSPRAAVGSSPASSIWCRHSKGDRLAAVTATGRWPAFDRGIFDGLSRGVLVGHVSPPPTALGWFLLVSFLLNFGHGGYPPLLPEVVAATGLS